MIEACAAISLVSSDDADMIWVLGLKERSSLRGVLWRSLCRRLRLSGELRSQVHSQVHSQLHPVCQRCGPGKFAGPFRHSGLSNLVRIEADGKDKSLMKAFAHIYKTKYTHTPLSTSQIS